MVLRSRLMKALSKLFAVTLVATMMSVGNVYSQSPTGVEASGGTAGGAGAVVVNNNNDTTTTTTTN
jgi:hypothetical protein